MVIAKELERVRQELRTETPLSYQAEIYVNIKEIGSNGTKDSISNEYHWLNEALNIWNGKNYNAKNVKDTLTDNNDRKLWVDAVLTRLKSFKDKEGNWGDYNDDLWKLHKTKRRGLPYVFDGLNEKINQLEQEKKKYMKIMEN